MALTMPSVGTMGITLVPTRDFSARFQGFTYDDDVFVQM